MSRPYREGNLEAPTRHPINWQDPSFYNEEELFDELERVYDICHGCRRCVSLCNAFPTLFDLVDESATFEVDGVAKKDYWKVVEHCYLCDLCYMTKCPYVPPHDWNVDFPHLMLRAKAVLHKKHGTRLRNKILSSTDTVGKLASIPVIANTVNTFNKLPVFRKALQAIAGIHENAKVPEYHANTLRKSLLATKTEVKTQFKAGERTTGKVAIFATCYGNYNEPQIGRDLAVVLEHNDIAISLVDKEQCCGMPKLELGDLDAVARAKEINIPVLVKLVEQGYDIIAPIPSCVLMFKQELPLMFPDDEQVLKVKRAIFDPFEYLMLRHKESLLRTDFNKTLGKVSYQAACHQRVQNIGMKTRDVLELIPGTVVDTIERCSGHDGTYAVKKEYHDVAMKIVKPVVRKINEFQPDHYTSDCAMAGRHIENALDNGRETEHPICLVRLAYGI